MANDLTHKTTHAKQALARFISQFKDATKLKAWAKTYLDQVQDLEDAAWEVLTLRALNTAEGVQLTVLGKLVGQPRQSADDDDFRMMIAARIALNLSCGSPEDLIKICRAALLGSSAFTLVEEPDRQVRITIDLNAEDFNSDVLFALLSSGDMAGSRLCLVTREHEAEDRLVLGDSVTGPREVWAYVENVSVTDTTVYAVSNDPGQTWSTENLGLGVAYSVEWRVSAFLTTGVWVGLWDDTTTEPIVDPSSYLTVYCAFYFISSYYVWSDQYMQLEDQPFGADSVFRITVDVLGVVRAYVDDVLIHTSTVVAGARLRFAVVVESGSTDPTLDGITDIVLSGFEVTQSPRGLGDAQGGTVDPAYLAHVKAG